MLAAVAGGTAGAGAGGTTAGFGSVTAPPGVTRYQQAVDGAASRGVKVWLEADLAKRWLAGSDQFHQGVAALCQVASRPRVVGVTVADELGYHSRLGDDANTAL